MKILFINPSWVTKGGIWKSVSSCFPPIGILQLSSILEKEGHEVKVIDLNVEELVTDFIPDFVGISITTSTAYSGYELSKKCKEIWPNVKIMMGGPQASVCPNETIKNCDVLVIGEADLLINEIVTKNLTGIIQGKLVEDINTLPMPSYHLINFDKYKPAVGSSISKAAMIMVTSRGCCNACCYCHQPFGPKIRQKSPFKLMEEIKYLVEERNIRELAFYDDNFATIKKNVQELCKLLIEYQKEKNIKLTFSCFMRLDWTDNQTIDLMKLAGCHQVLVGIESGDEYIREKIVHKNLNLEKAFLMREYLRNKDIEVRMSFILGLPEETKATMQKTIDLAIKLDPDICSFNVLSPSPGTPVFKLGVEQGLITDFNWDNYNLFDPIFIPKTTTKEEIIQMYKRAHRQFYFRISYILGRLKKSFTIEGLKTNLNGLKAILQI